MRRLKNPIATNVLKNVLVFVLNDCSLFVKNCYHHTDKIVPINAQILSTDRSLTQICLKSNTLIPNCGKNTFKTKATDAFTF